MKRLIEIVLAFIVSTAFCSAQETAYGPGFQTLLSYNPALSGSEGAGSLKLSYLNFYPGNHYGLHSVYASYDSYFPALHGGAAAWISDDYLGGIVNDVRGGLSYAYFLQAGQEVFINAGLSASVYSRGFNFGGAVLPDQIDPFNGISMPSSETLASSARTVFDIGAGFLIIYRNVFAGLSLSHLSQPEISLNSESPDKLWRKVNLHMSGIIKLNNSENIVLRPVGFIELQDDFFSAAGGTTLETSHFSINSLLIGDNNDNLNIQAGFSVTTGPVSIFYNYRFNVVSGNSMMPFSLLHQTGLAFGLNHVEKRNISKTITFPKL